MNNNRTSTCLALLLAAGLALGCSDDNGTTPPRDKGTPDTKSVTDGAAEPDKGVPASAPLTDQELIDGCARASACGILSYPVLSNCVGAYHEIYSRVALAPIYDRLYRCVNAAGGDCAAIANCYGRRGSCNSSYKATCEGTVAVSCDLLDKTVYALDCSAAGMSCGVKASQPSAATCTPGSCVQGSYQARCQGNRLLICTGGMIEVQDCSRDRAFCVTTKKGTLCRGNRRASCDTKSYKASCLGNVAVTCHNGREHWTDCGQFRAFKSACKGGACVPAHSACDHAMNRCAGDRLEVCLDGAWKTVDCKALGLGTCKPRSGWAQCTDPGSKLP